MEKGQIEAYKSSEVERIEKETGVRVPLFVSRWPAIDREKTAKLAIDFDLVDKEWQEQRISERAGLLFCRDHGVDIDEAFKNAASWERTRPSALELFERFLNPCWEKNQLAASEAKRREKRDLDILHLETDLLRKRGVEIPEFSSLIEYCGWIPEATGINQKYRKWGWTNLHVADEVYWDLMEHYAQIIKGAKGAFAPLTDFEQYLKKEKDITPWDQWNLQNMGEEDITYYSMSVRRGGGARTRSGKIDSPERLVTHSTPLNSARSIVESSYFDPRVCLSVGRVVSGKTFPEVTFIFDRQDLAKVYSIRKYGESSHENEVRCEEPIHVGFAISCVPLTRQLFPDYHGSSQGTIALGDETMQRWEKHYLTTGKLWDEKEIERIRAIARDHYSKD